MFRSLYHNANNKTLGVVNRLASWLFVRPRGALKHTEVVVSRAGQDTYQPRTIYRRPLDALETINCEYDKRGLNFGLTLASLKSTIPVEEAAVRQSLAMVSQRQPMLRATVMESPNSRVKYFESVEGRFKIDFCVMDRDIDDKAAIAEELFATTKFHFTEGPLWRTVLVPGKFDASSKLYYSALAFIYAHSIVDGPGTISVLQQVLGYLEAITNGTAPKLKDISSFPMYPSSSTLLAHKLANFKRSALFPDSANNSMDSSTTFINPVLSEFPAIDNTDPGFPIKPATKVLTRFIPAAKTTKLVTCCRKHGCTLTGALLAACHFALCSLLKTKPLPDHLTSDITCATAVTQDFLFSLPAGYVANHFGLLTYNLSLSTENSDFWKVANWCSKSIHSDISNGKHLEFISMLEDEWEAFLHHRLDQGNLKLANRQRSGHILSNVGQFLIENHPDKIFHCEDAFGGSPEHRRNGTFGNYLFSINGSLNWMTNYDASISSTKVAQSYSDFAWAILEHEMQLHV